MRPATTSAGMRPASRYSLSIAKSSPIVVNMIVTVPTGSRQRRRISSSAAITTAVKSRMPATVWWVE